MNETIARFMASRGSRFAGALAEAWMLASENDRARLEIAFPELVELYAADYAATQTVAA
jgi:hypothetical protein